MIHRFESIPSTQDLAHELAAQGELAGAVIVAREQTKGRGTRGREWSSGVGGLWLSVILRPSAEATEALSVRVGLELVESLSPMVAPERVDLKWPNDLIARDRKLGGILVETRWVGHRPAWVVVGVGLNVGNPLPEALSSVAIRLAELNPTTTVEALEQVVIAAVTRVATRSGGSLSAAELTRFARHDWLRGRRIEAPIKGTAAGISPEGQLLVTGPDGLARALTGPVTVAGLAPAVEDA